MATQSIGASYHSITQHIREFLTKDRPTFNEGWEVIRLLDTLAPSERELAIHHIKSSLSGLQVVMPNGDLPQDHWSNSVFKPLPGKLPGFTYMPPGTYMMGATPDVEEPEDEETPRCEVTITEGLDIANAPISRKDWYDVVVAPGHGVFPGSELHVDEEGDDGDPEPLVNGVVQYSAAYPIDNINWYESVKYCNLLSELHGLEPVYSFKGEEGQMGVGLVFTDSSLIVSGTADGFRLLREAEWECMARAGCNKALYGPLDDIAWHNDNSNGVGRSDEKLPNAWGFQDVLGNVWEWVFDAWRSNHPSEPITVLNNGFIPALDTRLGKNPSPETLTARCSEENHSVEANPPQAKSGHASTTAYGSESVFWGKQSEEDLELAPQHTSSSQIDSTSSHTSAGSRSESANEYRGGTNRMRGENANSSGQVDRDHTKSQSASTHVTSNIESPKSTTQSEYAEAGRNIVTSPSPSEPGKTKHWQQENMGMGGVTDIDYAGGVGGRVGKFSEGTPNTSTMPTGPLLTTPSYNCPSELTPANIGQPTPSDYASEGEWRGKPSEGSPSQSTDAPTLHRVITTKKYHARAYAGVLCDYLGTSAHTQRSTTRQHMTSRWHTLQERFMEESIVRQEASTRICRSIV